MPETNPILLHLPDAHRLVADPAEIYYLEADGDDTLVRFRGKDRVRDVRRLSDLEETLENVEFVRIHRSYIVNPARLGRSDRRPRAATGSWFWSRR